MTNSANSRIHRSYGLTNSLHLLQTKIAQLSKCPKTYLARDGTFPRTHVRAQTGDEIFHVFPRFHTAGIAWNLV